MAKECVEKHPGYSPAWVFLASVAELSGDLQAARTWLLKAMEVENHRPVVYSENLKTYSRALERVEKMIWEASAN
jgi:hypothetical protein